MKTLDIDDSDILYANFKNGIGVSSSMCLLEFVLMHNWKKSN